jgi:hypothetical protein
VSDGVLEGTAMARGNFRVLWGTIEELGVGHVRLTVILVLHKSVSPFPREFTKIFSKCF